MLCFMIVAVTADGLIAGEPSQVSTSWTSPEDKKWFSQRTKEAGVVVMGRSTFDTVGRPLPGRLNIVYSSQQKPTENPEVLRYTNQTPTELLESLKNENYSEVAICGGTSIYSMFMKAGLIDKIYLTVEPILFGKGLGVFNDNFNQKLKLVSVKNLAEDTLLLEYDVLKNEAVAA